MTQLLSDVIFSKLYLDVWYKPVGDRLRKQKARDGQDTAGDPDEADGDPGDAFAHSRSQRMDDGNVSFVHIMQTNNKRKIPLSSYMSRKDNDVEYKAM